MIGQSKIPFEKISVATRIFQSLEEIVDGKKCQTKNKAGLKALVLEVQDFWTEYF